MNKSIENLKISFVSSADYTRKRIARLEGATMIVFYLGYMIFYYSLFFSVIHISESPCLIYSCLLEASKIS